jgi:DNA repair protein RecO (recombination protein O)
MDERILRTITLHRRDFGESDRIAVLFSREEGKLAVTARGARKPTSRLAALVEPFSLSDCRVIRGRGEIQRLAGGEVVEPFHELRTDLRRFARAGLFCEVVDRAVADGQPVPRLFALLLDALRHLARGAPCGAVEAYYLLHATSILGYAFGWTECPVCERQLTGGPAVWIAEMGGLVCEPCSAADTGRRIGPATIGVLQEAAGKRLADFLAAPVGSPAVDEVVLLLRGHARYHLEIPLRSLDILAALPPEPEVRDGQP